MKIKNLFVYMAISAFALTSCNKDNDGDGGDDRNGEPFDMFLKFEIGAATKADTEEVKKGYVTEFTKGALFFVKDNGDIVRMAVIDDSPAGAVSATQLEQGYLFTGIDNSAKKVYVIGNHDFYNYVTKEYNTYANIAEVEAITKEILSQTNQDNKNTFGVEDATLYGAGDIIAASPGTQSKFPTYNVEREAIFEIAPIIARLEIDEVTAGGFIDGLSLAGIYINNFYLKMSVIGTTKIADLFHASVDPTNPVSSDYDRYLQTSTTQTNGQYDPDWYKYLFDDGDVDVSGDYQGLGTGALNYVPSVETWAYNVFANGTAVPHIILHFTDVTIDETSTGGSANTPRPNTALGAGFDGVAYLTITGYLAKGTQKDQPILGGNVYKLAEVLFDESNLTDYPYEEDDKDAIYVEVSVTPWNVIPVDWK